MKVHMVNPTAPNPFRFYARKPIVSGARVAGSMTRRQSANPLILPNPHKRRRRSRNGAPLMMMTNPAKRRRRSRNGAPMILANPKRRRRSSRNPSFNLMGGLKTGAMGLLAGGISYGTNRFVISKIGYKADQHWNSDDNRKGVLLRCGIRAALCAATAFFLPGSFGSALNGAMAYPAIYELSNWFEYRQASSAGVARNALTETATPNNPFAADLDYEADLQDILD